jgi:uncharacterized damage-inducible protein DinB
MSTTVHLNELLLPELELELAKTRRILAALPEGEENYKPHEKSMTLAKLAGHIAELPAFTSVILTTPGLDMAAPGNPRKPVVMESREQLLAQFDAAAEKAVVALKGTSDESFGEQWKLSRGEFEIYCGPRYGAYRAFAVNHIIHHRAQLGTYIRLLNHTLPGTYGPSADGM